jgi:hypothetical protein
VRIFKNIQLPEGKILMHKNKSKRANNEEKTTSEMN